MRNVSYVAVIILACFSNPALAGNKDFNAKFDRCGEYVGIGYVPAARARSLVPSRYALAGDSTNALLVVRVASCAEVSVDGKKSGVARTAQIGVMLNGPDASVDINNYLLWFITDLGNLHGKLQAAGIKNGNDQQLKLVFEPVGGTGTLAINVSSPRFPAFPLLGTAQAPSSPPQSYLANWWADGKHGVLRMQTSFQELRFGEADLVLTPSPDSELADLIGSPSLSFSVLNSYNEWQTATLQSTLQ
jgi:hypothetical protein